MQEKNEPSQGRETMSVSEAGRKGGETVSRERGPEFYREIGKKGGETVARERGPKFYEEIGKKGGQRVSELFREGKEAEGRHDNR